MKKLLLALQFLIWTSAFAQSEQTSIETNYISYDAYLSATKIGDYKYHQSNVRSLVNQFKLLCPDTICEGRYGTVVPVQFYCSIEKTSLQMGQCVWVFAAMEPHASHSNGTITTDARIFECSFTPNADAQKFRDFMRRAGFRNGVGSTFGITRTGIPGLGKTLWDIVLECFASQEDEEL